MNTPAVGITVLAAVMLGVWPLLLWRARMPNRGAMAGRLALVLLTWAGLWLALGASGVLADVTRRPPAAAVLFPALTIGVALLARSLSGAIISEETSLATLVALQAFRLPLELFMHEAAEQGLLPRQMTFGAGGLNYDIVTGVTALLLGLWLLVHRGPRQPSRSTRWLVLGWNVLASALLINIVVVSVLSTPLFARFGNEPSQLNTWVLHAPAVLLPAVLVGSALLGHTLIFQRLLRERTTGR